MPFAQSLESSLKKIVDEAIAHEVFPACVVGVVRTDGAQLIVPAGQYTYDKTSPSVHKDTIFDIASITKSIPTSSLALQCIDSNTIHLDDSVTKYLPELKQGNDVLVRHLLTQTLDYNFALSDFKHSEASAILQAIFTTPFATPPGTTYHYSNATSVLLGLLVERVMRAPLDVLADKHLFKPLGMSNTTFHPPHPKEVVPTEKDSWRNKLIQGEVHDESAWKLEQAGLIPGSAGLFSTVPDLLQFMQMLLCKGSLKGKRYLSSEILDAVQTNQIANLGQETGLGWELHQPRYMGKLSQPTTFGKTGFTGCSVVCDIERSVALVILSNHQLPHRKPDGNIIHPLRARIADCIFESCL